MSVVKGFLVLLGWIAALAAIALLAGGGGLLWFQSQNEMDGYYVSDTLAVRIGSSALYAPDIDIVEDVPGWFSEEWFAAERWESIRITGRSVNGKDIFIGIAPRGAVDTYLAGTAHHRLSTIDLRPILGTAQLVDGTSPPPPAEEAFWDTSVQSSDLAALEWPVRTGSWGVVVMNADGSAGVEASIILAAEVPFVGEAGTQLLVSGIAAFVLALLLLYFGGRAPSENSLERQERRAERRRIKAEAAADAKKTREEAKAAARSERENEEATAKSSTDTTSTSAATAVLTDTETRVESAVETDTADEPRPQPEA